MGPKKRALQSTQLEDVVDAPVVTKKSRKGQLDKPKTEVQDSSREELFKRRQAAKSGTERPSQSPDKGSQQPPTKDTKGDTSTSTSGVWVNRAPVLTLWVAVVAQRQGFSRESGLTFGKAIAGLLAQSKGRAIGVFGEKDKDETAKSEQQKKDEQVGVEKVDVFGMRIKGIKADGGQLLAIDKGTTSVKPAAVQSYLSTAFGGRLQDVEKALTHLAEGFDADEIGSKAYHLYENFRPSVPTGQAGWGRKGLLELEKLTDLRP